MGLLVHEFKLLARSHVIHEKCFGIECTFVLDSNACEPLINNQRMQKRKMKE